MNSSALQPPSLAISKELVIYSLYLLLSGSISVCSLIVFASIVRYTALHSNAYIVVSALCLADGLHQFAYAAAGAYRLYLLFTGGLFVRCCRAFECMLTLHNLLWIFTEPFSNLMLAIVSMDRLVCVLFPLSYIGVGRTSIGRGLVSAAVVFSSLSAGVGLLDSGLKSGASNVSYPAACILSHSVSLNYRMYISAIRQIFAGSSVVFYMLVPIFYKRQIMGVAPIASHLESTQEAQRKRQRCLTKSMGISCAVTFFVLQLPMFVTGLVVYLGLPLPSWTKYSLIIVANFNPLCNLYIFLSRQKELRKAVLSALRCKHLPINIELW